MARKTNVRQHTRNVKGRPVNVVRHQRSLQPESLGRVGVVKPHQMTMTCSSCGSKVKDTRSEKYMGITECAMCVAKKKKNVVAPDFTTTKYFKGETWEPVNFKDGLYTLQDGKGNTEYAWPEEVGEKAVKFPRKQLKALNDARFLEVMEGGEVWTNAFGDRFGERVCVGFEKGKIAYGGKRFTPTAAEFEELKDDVARAEWGTTDPKKIMKLEGF